MDQYQVWEIKLKMQSKADDFKSEEADVSLIAIKKGDVKMMMKKWENDLNNWWSSIMLSPYIFNYYYWSLHISIFQIG